MLDVSFTKKAQMNPICAFFFVEYPLSPTTKGVFVIFCHTNIRMPQKRPLEKYQLYIFFKRKNRIDIYIDKEKFQTNDRGHDYCENICRTTEYLLVAVIGFWQ